MTAVKTRRTRLIAGFASWHVTLAAALLALGFLVAAQMRAQAPEQQYTTQERQPLANTVRDLQAKHQSLTEQIQQTQAEIDSLRRSKQGSGDQLTQLNNELAAAKLAAGFVTVQGGGGYIYLADGTPPVGSDANPADFRVSAADLRALIDALWSSGAEALSINNERIVTTTSILDYGGSILINSAYVSGPFTISVIAPKDVWDQLVKVDAFRGWSQNRLGPYSLTLKYKAADDVVVPGYGGGASLRNSQIVPRSSALPSSGP